jgi:hypothetical protein
VEERENLKFESRRASFFSMNTPAEYAAAVEQWERSRPDRAEAAGR